MLTRTDPLGCMAGSSAGDASSASIRSSVVLMAPRTFNSYSGRSARAAFALGLVTARFAIVVLRSFDVQDTDPADSLHGRLSRTKLRGLRVCRVRFQEDTAGAGG